MRELHLFAGIGGGVLAGKMLGHRPVGMVELNDYCRGLLQQRFPGVPTHDDIKTFKGEPDSADIVAGGFPCQDIAAPGKGKGLEGARSGLWFEMLRVVREVGPSYVFLENSPLLRTRGLGTILSGLSDLGFDAEWGVFSAASVGAPHLRKRLWLLGAHPDRARLLEQRQVNDHDRPERAGHDPDRLRPEVSYPVCERLSQREGPESQWAQSAAAGSAWWASEPRLGRLADGAATRLERSLRVARIRAIGNAQVPLQAATAFRRLYERFTLNK